MSNENGRDNRGRFTEGNAGGPGNPHGGQVARLRAAFFAAVTEDDLREIVADLVERAKGGDARAAREVLDRTVGKPRLSVDLTTMGDRALPINYIV